MSCPTTALRFLGGTTPVPECFKAVQEFVVTQQAQAAVVGGQKKKQRSRQRRLESGKVRPSRVNAACFEIKGQPFYGWFVDGSKDKTQARFLTGFSSSRPYNAWPELGRSRVNAAGKHTKC
jgi:hypothetical protein